MTDFDYPRTATYDLSTVLADVEDELSALDEHSADGDDRNDEQKRAALQRTTHALEWAVDEFSDDAELTLRGLTAMRRATILDTMNQQMMGTVGSSTVDVWLVAGQIESAPWLDGDETLREQAESTGELPPALQDWLRDKTDELNDLTEGN